MQVIADAQLAVADADDSRTNDLMNSMLCIYRTACDTKEDALDARFPNTFELSRQEAWGILMCRACSCKDER